MELAQYFTKTNEKVVRCCLCPNECIIKAGKSGICRYRKNHGGMLYAENYGRVAGFGIDPIEKKPLYHFLPGSSIVSVGTLGCNFRCSFCQNWSIAHGRRDTIIIAPQQLVDRSLREKSIGIAYTYNEPTVWYEYVYHTAKLAKKKGLKNVLVTNGYINEQPLDRLLEYIDGVNIDVKAFKNEFYRDIVKGRLEDVKKTVAHCAQRVHVEITALIIPGLNDRAEEMINLSKWLAQVNPAIPLHLTRYFPNYKMDIPPTPPKLLYTLKDIAQGNLEYVYIGNLGNVDNNTYCPKCGSLLIKRDYIIEMPGVKGGLCTKCGYNIYGVFN
jgi:pyruvate formate lyase activating enzyme